MSLAEKKKKLRQQAKIQKKVHHTRIQQDEMIPQKTTAERSDYTTG